MKPGLSTAHVRRLGLPDRYVLHAERDEQLAEVGLDVDGIMRATLALAKAVGSSRPKPNNDAKTKSALGSTSTPVAQRSILGRQSIILRVLSDLGWERPSRSGRGLWALFCGRAQKENLREE